MRGGAGEAFWTDEASQAVAGSRKGMFVGETKRRAAEKGGEGERGSGVAEMWFGNRNCAGGRGGVGSWTYALH